MLDMVLNSEVQTGNVDSLAEHGIPPVVVSGLPVEMVGHSMMPNPVVTVGI